MVILKRIILTSNIGLNLLRTVTAKCSNKTMSQEEAVLFTSVKSAGIICLNRPKALNALNFSMVNKLYPKLQQWEKEKNLVIIKGTGEKSFCAGGDVRAIVEAGLRGEKLGYDFFRTEYTLNGLIGSYGIPYIALIDGIVMGGGVGVSVHGHYRIATERTLFAMPETAIGLFPDVGGTYVLPRLGGKLGYYLALTGHRLKGTDVLKAGIATHYCKSTNLPRLEEALVDTSSKQDIEKVLNTFCTSTAPFSLEPYLEKINTCFAAPTVEDILNELNKDGSEWAHSTARVLAKMSPTSLKVTLKALKMGAHMTLQDCLEMEYRIACSCLENNDFYEGVRALLIDKNQNPKWKPDSLAAVTDKIVNSYFSKLPEEQELTSKL